jgi:diacylglycerol O-acyltransferase / wax synthase
LLPELAVSVGRLPFNKACSGDRKFCWAEFDFADVRAIRQSVGGKVNDIILTVLTRALARYAKLHRQTVVNRFVRIVCPVNLRNGDNSESPGNQISFMPVALPMDVRDPIQMLQAVSKRTATMKHAGAAHLVALAGGCIAAAPAPVQALLWKGIPQTILPIPLFNMVCTDVPGPQMPLYAVGRRMIAIYPQVPTGWDLGINCAVQTYDGKLRFGLIADADVAPDVRRLRDFLYVAFKELCRSAGVRGAGQKTTQPGASKAEVARKQPSKPAEDVPSSGSQVGGDIASGGTARTNQKGRGRRLSATGRQDLADSESLSQKAKQQRQRAERTVRV